MRRKEREVTQVEALEAILRECPVCRIGMVDHGKPYVVPVNFGYTREGDVITVYFHCAGQGRKVEVLKQNPQVCFEADCRYSLREAAVACEYSCAFASVIGEGRAVFLEDPEEKRTGLTAIMTHLTGDKDFTFAPAHVDGVSVVKIVLEQLSGKEKA